MNTATRLKFTHDPEIWEDSEPTDHWKAGIYKITLYPEDSENKYKPSYRAYFKPHGWKNWGNCVAVNPKVYNTLTEAKAACQQHADKYEQPYENDRI